MSEHIGGVDELDGFPVSDYYQNQIREARTINRTGSWWSAILLIEDPKTNKTFLAFYRWQKKNNVWKVSKSFTCRSKKDGGRIIKIINELLPELD